LNINNGARFSTYVIQGDSGSGEICINGAAARLVAKGDKAIILSYQQVPDDEAAIITPRLVYVNSANQIVHVKNEMDWAKDLISTI